MIKVTNRDPQEILRLILNVHESKGPLDTLLLALKTERIHRSYPTRAEAESRLGIVANSTIDSLLKRTDLESKDFIEEPRTYGAKTSINGFITTELGKLIRETLGEPKEQADAEIVLTESQEAAWAKLLNWLPSSRSFFILRGYAGTGKSFLLKKLSELDHNFHFSAPTNKATKVLSSFIGHNCKTTYSLLGLRMVTDEDQKVLGKMERIPDLGNQPILVIDEASMIPKHMAELLQELCETEGWRVIFVGDPAQLNPVKEPMSIVWSFADKMDRALLTEVKRFDNQLLHLSIKIRECLKTKDYENSKNLIIDDHLEDEGVFVKSKMKIINDLKKLSLDQWKTTKVACWRNRTVDEYTRIIREALGFTNDYDVNDLITLATPVVGHGGTIQAYVDEEFQIKSISERRFEFDEGIIDARAITLYDLPITLYVPEDPSSLQEILAKRARKASQTDGHTRRTYWRQFWDLKEQFHDIRHGYALTVHRMQGTTIDHIYVDRSDIMANPNKREALRCLYVAATRPRFSLTTF
jgi:exodeoxyribonuclease V